MAFDGNGNFVRLYSWVSDKTNGIDITASRFDGEDNGFAAGLTLCVTRDGQGKMGADFLPAATTTYNLGNVTFTWKSITSQYFTSSSTGLKGYGPNAAALVDMTPDSGSFTGTLTGMTGSVTSLCSWVRVGKLVILMLGTATGTSNSIGFSMTGLPAAIQPATQKFIAVPVGALVDNGSFVDAGVAINGGTGTLTFDKVSGSWTASGTKGFDNVFEIVYSLQ